MEKKNHIIAGVDEAGQGALAGPVFAAAVILDPRKKFPGLKDSKQLTKKKREELFELISRKALAVSVGRAEVHEIETLNIHYACMLAMQRALEGLALQPSLILIDGRSRPKMNLEIEVKTIVKGDQSERPISAASIIAKVSRDREMKVLDQLYPTYQFQKHKGYGTQLHLDSLQKYGPCPVHRRTYAPIAELQDRNVPSLNE